MFSHMGISFRLLSSGQMSSLGCLVGESLLLLLIPMIITSALQHDGVFIVSVDDQERGIAAAKIQCLEHMLAGRSTSNGHCNRTWDGILCWKDTPLGQEVPQPCPSYINGFKVSGNATRRCLLNGDWFVHPILNHTWTNYSGCMSRVQLPGPINVEEHVLRIKLMYNVGYGASFVSLVTAVSVMIYFKRLHCPRNTVHINLFLSFIMRAAVSFTKDNLLVDGLGLPGDLELQPDGSYNFRKEGTHWQCKLLFTVFHYSLGANYVWIFVEGLYLHNLIFVTVFSDRSGVGWYILIGWASPLLFIIPWVIVRVLVEDTLCWNTNPTPGYFWIMRGPIVVSIAINFLFFLNIVRVLFTKLHTTNTPEARRYKYRKLARSTLVLIPLFGVHGIVFMGFPDGIDDRAELVKIYFEMFFNSFQGFLVASLFCFFNGEVQGEVRKKWVRWRMGVRKPSRRNRRRQWYTSSSYYSRNRNSQLSLQSFGLEKPDSSSQDSNGQICQRCLMERRQFRVYVERCRRLNVHAVRIDKDEAQPVFRVTFERDTGF